MNRRFVSTQIAFFLVSLVILVLLVGSVVLGRIVFKAASAGATVYFSQLTVQAKPGTTVSVNVLADLSAAVNMSGVQLEVNFDPKILKLASSQPAALWKQVFSKVGSGKLFLVMVPLEPGALIDKASSGLNLALLKFTTLEEGSTNLTLTPALTMLAVFGAPGTKGVENIVETIVNTQVRVTSQATTVTPEDDKPIIDAVFTGDKLGFSSQRIISTSQILTANSAVILVRLEHPSRISVAFGQSLAFGNRADYSTRVDQAAIRIAGLNSGQRYFYQVEAVDDNATNRVLGQVKSFELPVISSANTVDRAELTIFPTGAVTSATAYAVLFDRDNKIVGGLAPQLQVDNEPVSATKFSEVAGLYQATLGSFSAKSQTVRYLLLLDGQKLAGVTAVFDPPLDNSVVNSGQSFLAIKFDQKTINLILALVAGLILLGLGFYKLVRER